MGKFFKGEFGHILVAVKPTGFRRYACLRSAEGIWANAVSRKARVI